MIEQLLWLVVIILIVGLAFWGASVLIAKLGLPEPWGKLAQAVVVIAGLVVFIVLILRLLRMAGVALP